MSRDDWYRNREWNQETEDLFLAKLKRARSGKAQYLRIQACTLRDTHPDVAHRLLDMYFELDDRFDHAQAHVDRAHAFLAQGLVEPAIIAFEAALRREQEFSNLQTQAGLDLSFMIATRHARPHYPRALSILASRSGSQMFPVDRFRWNAANALIGRDLGSENAAAFAAAALGAAAEDSSGFRYHRTLGLVGEQYPLLRRELEIIAHLADDTDRNERQDIH